MFHRQLCEADRAREERTAEMPLDDDRAYAAPSEGRRGGEPCQATADDDDLRRMARFGMHEV